MKRKLYNGTTTVSRDEGHCYHVSDTEAKPDGVTTILGLVPKYLLPWCAKITAEHFRSGLLRRMEDGETITDLAFINGLHDEAKKAHTVKRDTAGDIGSAVHDFAEKTLKGHEPEMPSPSDPEYPGCVAFLEWFKNTKIDLSTVQSEIIVYSKRLFYAGTCDVFARIDDEPVIIDFKTGSGFYEDQTLQLAAYAMALEEEHEGLEIKHGFIIHLNKQTGEMTPYHVPITDELKTDWEAVRISWRAVKRNQDRHKQIRAKAKGKTRCRTSAITIAAAQL